MKSRLILLTLAALLPLGASRAQLLPPNQAGVTFGQWNTIVRDVDAAKKFWTAMGGVPIQIDGTTVMKFPGVLVFLTPGIPIHASEGTVMNHLGFYVPNVEETASKWKAAGVRIEYVSGRTTGGEKKSVTGEDVAWVYSPDDLKLELHGYRYIAPDLKFAYVGDKTLTRPIVGTHNHIAVLESSRKEMQAWYMRMFGGDAGVPAILSLRVGGVPGMNMSIGKSPDAPLPTKGAVLDHIGFEVKGLEVFCNRLESNGIKFDQPYSKTRHKSFASAQLTDPWGLSIELTEGLSRF
jgi:catechol 2,3-dioxygenase-like lactoylglutathione lyase family enzyme